MLKLIISLPLFFSCITSFSQSTASDSELAKTENQFYTALITNDFSGLDPLYDDSFHGILADGKSLVKSEMLEYQKTKDSRVAKSFENLVTRVLGDVAITTGTEVNRAKSGTVIGQVRFMRIFVRKNNVWTIINSQYTSII